MAVVKMDGIHICALKRDRKGILELLQRRGTVEVRDSGTEPEDSVFGRMDTSTARGMFEKSAETAGRALEILQPYQTEKRSMTAFLYAQKPVSIGKNEEFIEIRRDAVMRVAQQVVSLDRRKQEAQAEILRTDMLEASLEPWMSLPVPQTFGGTKKTAFFAGSLEGEHTVETIAALLAEASPELDKLHIEIVSSDKVLTCFYVISPRGDAAKTEEALRAVGFTRPASPGSRLPADEKKRLAGQREAATKEIAACEAELTGYVGEAADIRYLEDYMTMRADKYAVIEQLAQSAHTFSLEGYVPAKYADGIKRDLEQRFTCEVGIASAEEDGKAPVSLKNSAFAEPTESVLENFSLPAKSEVDPTAVMSIFYYVMFGMMFSDAGYGFIMAAVCGILLLKIKDMKPNWVKNLRMFFWCGVSTVFWGIMFSSYFGDVVTSVGETFFGKTVTIPALWFVPLDDPMGLLMFCLLIGIIHLTTGYIMKGVISAKAGDYAAIIYDTVFPITIMYPMVVVLMGSEIFESLGGFRLDLPPAVTYICFGIAVVSIIGTILTAGRESRSWGKRTLKGLYGLYNILAGWISDTLSYSRLLALGLSTGVIASVFNQLGGMVGGAFAGIGVAGKIIGIIPYVAVFAVGHALNFGINVLGAYVHSNRLEYVEFFGKFYEGGGEKFVPFGMNTKYYKIEEETRNV